MAGYEQHGRALPGATAELQRISSEIKPSSWLEEAASEEKVVRQLGTLGGGNHFLEVLFKSLPIVPEAATDLRSQGLLILPTACLNKHE